MTSPYRVDEDGAARLRERLSRLSRREATATRSFWGKTVRGRVLPALFAAMVLVWVAAHDHRAVAEALALAGPAARYRAALPALLLGYLAVAVVVLRPERPSRRPMSPRRLVVACLLIAMCVVAYLSCLGPKLCQPAKKGAAQIDS